MPRSDTARLLELSQAVSDGSAIDWAAELRQSPRLGAELRRLQQLAAIAGAHRSLPASGMPGARPSPETPARATGDAPFRWGPLQVVEHIGRGAFGDVYLAIDTRLQSEVALKLRRIGAAEGETARRFFAEARSLARIRHPNVVVVHGAAVHGGRVGFWTDLVHGRTLAELLFTQGPVSVKDAAEIGLDLSRALAAVHAAGLVHGDLKAANAMREPSGRTILMDFGAAKWLAHPDATAGDREPVIGTPLIMAPEVLAGGSPAVTADLYALGVLLYQLLSGRYPYEGRDVAELRRQQASGERAPLQELRRDLPPALLAVLARALEPDPAARFASAVEMEQALAAAIGAPISARPSLPAELDALVGRERELARLAQPFAEGARLVTLSGPAGMGKTRLAVRFGWQSGEQWPGGVWFCDLTAVGTRDGFVSAVGKTLGVALGQGDPVAHLGQSLAERGRSLFILDNCEQVVEVAGELVSQWLARAPELSFLITSRERLNLRGERVQVVEPLTLTDGVRLFIERARSHRPDFALVAPGSETVTAVVQLLEGIPLAIELAAARMRVMSAHQVLVGMQDRFRVLGRSDARPTGEGSARHATLRAAIDGSWELLAPWEQSALAQCAVFHGGFTLEAAESVLDLAAWPDAPWVVDVVQSLVDKSLLRTLGAATPAAGAPMRFGMFMSLQAYASAKLLAEGAVPEGGSGAAAAQAAEERHARFYARYGTANAIQALTQHAGSELRAVMASELDNLVVGCRRAAARGDRETVAELFRAATHVLEVRGPIATVVELGAAVLACDVDDSQRAAIHTRLGAMERLCGRSEEARAHHDAALACYRARGDRAGEAIARSNLGVLEFEQGRMAEGRLQLEAALALHRETGNRRGEGIALGNLGTLHSNQGRLAVARTHLEGALAIAREVGDRSGQGNLASKLGNLCLLEGRMAEARVHYEAALAIAQETGDRRREAVVLGNLGILSFDRGRREAARSEFERALALYHAVGDRFNQAGTLGNLGELERAEGHLSEARAALEEALALHRESGSTRGEASVLGSLGQLEAAEGRMVDARAMLQRGEELLRAVGDQYELANLLCARAAVEHRHGAHREARSFLKAAESLAVEAGNDSELGRRLAAVRVALG